MSAASSALPDPALPDPALPDPALRASVGESFNVFQATVAMVAIFIGFVFAALLQVLLTVEALSVPRTLVVWLLTISMITLSASLILFHATAHEVILYWKIFYPRSDYGRAGAVTFSVGLLCMFGCLSVLLWEKAQLGLGLLNGAAGLGIVVFGFYFRRMHNDLPHKIDVRRKLPSTVPMRPEGLGTSGLGRSTAQAIAEDRNAAPPSV